MIGADRLRGALVLGALSLLRAALWAELVWGLPPCPLCLWQRAGHLVGAVGLRHRWVGWTVAGAAGTGLSGLIGLCEPPRAKPRGFPAVSGGVEPPPTAEVFCHMVGAAAGAAGLGRRKSQRASSSAACRSASHSAPSRARNVDPERCPLSTVPVRQSVLLV